jgi:hypothetical protein
LAATIRADGHRPARLALVEALARRLVEQQRLPARVRRRPTGGRRSAAPTMS